MSGDGTLLISQANAPITLRTGTAKIWKVVVFSSLASKVWVTSYSSPAICRYWHETDARSRSSPAQN